MRWPLAMLIGAAVCAAAPGCHSNNCGLVEAELRAREKELGCAKEELHRQRVLNQALTHELAMMRGDLPPGGFVGNKPPLLSPIRGIELTRQTGGHDAGGAPWDDGLQVVVEPKDADNHAVKVPGVLVVHVLEVTPEGLKKPLSTWQVPPDELSRSWRSGLISTGYVLLLPWKAWPCTEKLRVVATLQLADGRTFEADRDVTVRLAPPNQRPAPVPEVIPVPPFPVPGPPVVPGPVVPPKPGDILPLPRKSDDPGPALGSAVTVGKPQAPSGSSGWQPATPQVQLGAPVRDQP